MTNKTSGWIVVLLGMGLLRAETPPARAVECAQARPKDPCTITIDAATKLIPGPTTVQSGTSVTILVVHKNPLDTVQFTIDRTAATPPENPLTDLMTLVTTTGIAGALQGIALAPTATTNGARMSAQSAVSRMPKNPSEGVEKKLVNLAKRINVGSEELEKLAQNYTDLGSQPDNLPGCTTLSPDLTKCQTSAKDMAKKIEGVVAQGIPSFDDEKEMLKKIDEDIDAERTSKSDEVVVDHVQKRDAVAASIEAQQFAIDTLKRSQSALDTLATSLKKAAASAKIEAPFSVPPDRNTDTTVHVKFSPDAGAVEVPVVVHFQNWAWATMSAGVVITGFKRDSFSVNPHFDPAATDSTKQTYATIDRQTATRQIVPFSFANFQERHLSWRCGGHDIAPTASVGVGVNVTTQSAEFVVGPGIHIGRVQFVVGAHWARSSSLIDGFTLGQHVDGSLKPPMDNPYVRHWSVGITYRVR